MTYRTFENTVHKEAFKIQAYFAEAHTLIQVVWIGGSNVKRGTYTIGINRFKQDARFLDADTEYCYIPIESFNFRKEH